MFIYDVRDLHMNINEAINCYHFDYISNFTSSLYLKSWYVFHFLVANKNGFIL